jgi:glutaminyl-tRNA synthetase
MGTLHWVSAEHSISAEVRLYDHLFTKENPLEDHEGADFKDLLNPESLKVLSDCQLEPGLKEAPPGSRFQFLRQGYFCVDTEDSSKDKLVFNRTVPLRDTWAKIQKAQKAKTIPR